LAIALMVVSACAPPPAALPLPAVAPDAPALPYVALLGRRAGPTVALVAGVHGGKVAAVRALESLHRTLGDELIRGRVILVAPANLAGYQAGLAQISPDDSLNLNRVFPGVVCGEPTERLASRIMREIVSNSDYLVDLHGSDGEEAVGRFAYAARPGVDPRVDSLALRLATAWGVPTIIWDDAGPRTRETARFLQTAAHLSGVPAITVFEAGAAREDSVATRQFIAGAMAVLADLQMVRLREPVTTPRARAPRVLPRRAVTSAPSAGHWSPLLHPGQEVADGDLLGTFRDATGAHLELRATSRGLVLHQRLAGAATAGTPLIILGVVP
jgi:predicted deacylase